MTYSRVCFPALKQLATPIIEEVVGIERHVRRALRSLIGTRRPPLSGAHVPAPLHRAPGNFTPQKPFASELAPPEEIETDTCLLKESRIARAYGLTTRPVAKRPGSRGFSLEKLPGNLRRNLRSPLGFTPAPASTPPSPCATSPNSPSPAIDTKPAAAITQIIRAAHTARHEAHVILEKAKRAVEIAIEECEAAALLRLTQS